ncbi:MAG: hypothetical protein M3177_05440 [Pseudomonadota bacterium]|nr:hypothetical protein [Pseudomonadota bacterium]
MRLTSIVILWLVCAGAGVGAAAAEPSGVRGEVAAMAAWNRGDLEAALQSYCPSPEMSWVSASGLTHGFEPFARPMRQLFARNPGAMGRMTAEALETARWGKGARLVVLRWSIDDEERRLMGGISTQLWAPCQGRMRIVLEHAS